jgi:cyclopropane-fatty-acyl-phospholipid synthase
MKPCCRTKPFLRLCPPTIPQSGQGNDHRIRDRLIGTFEQSRKIYLADFWIYAVLIICLLSVLVMGGYRTIWPTLALYYFSGLAIWTLIEYVMHRFILHGLKPFKQLHEMHHIRPRALMGTPTIATILSFACFVFLPTLLLANLWTACALTMGVLTGYLAYSLLHHATHHWRMSTRWLKERKKVHGLHHQFGRPGYYGVTTSFWDHVFGSMRSK